MKASHTKQLFASTLALALCALTAFALSMPKMKMKMTTPIPPGIITPDVVETRLETLKFTDGFPDDATVKKVLDNLDFQRGVQSILTSIPATSLHAMREGIRG